MPDELLTTTEPELLVQTDMLAESVTLVEAELLIESVQELVEVAVPELLIEQIAPSLEVLDAQAQFEVLEMALQGPPGPPGQSGDATIAFPASAAMSGHRAVRLIAGQLVYADALTLADANAVLGISRNAAVLGAPVVVQTSGLMTEPSWAWTPDRPVFCGPAGALTQSTPANGFSLIVGMALAATQIFIGAKTPIALA